MELAALVMAWAVAAGLWLAVVGVAVAVYKTWKHN